MIAVVKGGLFQETGFSQSLFSILDLCLLLSVIIQNMYTCVCAYVCMYIYMCIYVIQNIYMYIYMQKRGKIVNLVLKDNRDNFIQV